MTKLKTFKDLRIEEELCYRLDLEVYLPVKEELSDINRSYSLGPRKEDFKKAIEFELLKPRQEAIKYIEKLETCHDCGRKIGEYHMISCDEVRCKYCGRQALSCDCTKADKFHTIVGSVDSRCNRMDFRNKELVDWIKHFFNI